MRFMANKGSPVHHKQYNDQRGAVKKSNRRRDICLNVLRNSRLKLVVDRYSSFVVELDANFVESQPSSEWPSTDTDEQDITVKLSNKPSTDRQFN